jgi:hypothetical protein
MGDPLVAINAGFAPFFLPLHGVFGPGAALLHLEIHVRQFVAVAALLGI